MRDNDAKTIRFVWMEISFALGGYMPSSSGGRSIVWAGSEMKIFAIGQLQLGDF